jgi:hypothetical protein
MNTLERPDAPTLEVRIARPELMRHNRWNAGYFEERFRRKCGRSGGTKMESST